MKRQWTTDELIDEWTLQLVICAKFYIPDLVL